MISNSIYCNGSYKEIGKQEGRMLAKEISSNVKLFWEKLIQLGYKKENLLKSIIKQEKLLTNAVLEEIEGISKGSNQKFLDLLAYNVYHDLAFPEECTVMMAVGRASSTGSTIFLKNSDKVGSESYVGDNCFKNKEINVLLALNPENGNNIIGVAAAGSTALKMGLNDKGVATGSNIARTKELATKGIEKDTTQLKALDRGFLSRIGLEQSDDAIEAAQVVLPRLMSSPMSTPGNIHFADADRAIIIEGSYHEIAAETIVDKVAARANRFQLLSQLNRDDDLSSICRYTRCMELLNENEGKIDVDKMIEFSMDHVNGPGPNSICRHGDHFLKETSLSSAVMEINRENPEKSKISIALGKPCHAWRDKKANITLSLDSKKKDIPEGFINGEIWKKYYTEEPFVKNV